MDDDLPFASHIVRRGPVYQYVRRIPDDVREAFPLSRIQRSLRTREKAQAFSAAASVHAEVERQFAAARRAKGVTLHVIPIDGWEWPDWQKLADWFEASLAEKDWQARLRALPGSAYRDGFERKHLWRDAKVVRAHLALRRHLDEITVVTYAEERFGFVHSSIKRLGIPLSRAMPHFERFMAACQRAELCYLAVFIAREGGEASERPHPDTIVGKWKAAAASIDGEHACGILGSTPLATRATGKFLHDCLQQWKADRKRANKVETLHGLSEKESAIRDFEAHAKVRDIGEITRAHIIAYRDHLSAAGLMTPTYNKRVGQVTTLLTTAKRAGWIDADISGGVYVEVPAGTNEREPFATAELDTIFTHATFSAGSRSRGEKAAGELEFWLPLISLTGGLISSEIMQLGPEMIGPHPDHPSIICYHVSNAGGRALKALSRKRYVPVRRELLEGGLNEIVTEAHDERRRFIWPAVEKGKSVNLISNMYSAFWSDHLRRTLNIPSLNKTLYSLRHNFRDGISTQSATAYEKDQLMGHSEIGTGAKYGTKTSPRVVDIARLAALVQDVSWPCLRQISWPNKKL